jgi:ubiquinone/menaquinone biosynthesis C-methylase UbiE
MTETQTDWGAYALYYDALMELTPYVQMLRAVAAAAQDGAAPLLDAGCGTGNLLYLLSQQNRREMSGLDSSTTMLARAREKCPGVRLEYADLNTSLSLPDGCIGTITCVNALYALPRPSYTLAEFRRVLVPGGSLVIATPKRGYENGLILKAHCGSKKPDEYWLNAHASPEREEMLVREAIIDETLVQRMLSVAKVNRQIAHTTLFNFFTEEELRGVLAAAKFEIVEYAETYAHQSHLIVARKHET